MTQPDRSRPSGAAPGPAAESGAPPADETAPGGAGAALIEVVICSGFPTQLALALILGGIGLQAVAGDGRFSFAYIVTLSCADAVLLMALVVYFVRARGESMRELITGGRPAGREARLGMLLIPVLVIVVVGGLLVIRTIAPALHNVADNPLESMLSTPTRALVFGLVVVIAGGVREELQRAFVLRRFEQHLGGGWLGLAIFSVAFGLGHYVQGWDAAIMTGLLGLLWGTLYLVRRSIVASVVSHAGFNLVEIIIAVTAGQT